MNAKRTATLYRMVLPDHVCPYGLKSRFLLQREGYVVDDRPLRTRAETDEFKARHDVATTPQTWIGTERIGGYDALRRHFGRDKDGNKAQYRPVVAVFGISFLLALATTYLTRGDVAPVRSAELFVAFSMTLLALQKIRDVENFSTTFLHYDLLGRRWVPYSYIYPYAAALAGILMVAGMLSWLAAPIAVFIGAVGAVSVFKAVYVDRQELLCACVGGDSKVPLGFVSLLENLMMLVMGTWMALRLWVL
ncbi:MAG TPA: MauE/DoxX family redox-associated membrane protein [Woeseiaceae bacterium]|nr:MauE/DoxX family redox-associated membrane protein [Woeseiaceae bacterium]